MSDDQPAKPTATDIERCAALLESLVDDRGLLAAVDKELVKRLLTAAGRLSRPDKRDKKKLARARRKNRKVKKRDKDEALLARTGIRRMRDSPIFLTPKNQAAANGEPWAPRSEPPLGQTSEERVCYVCREPYHDVHFFYDQLCPSCGDFNYAKRSPSADLNGRVALVTGGRVKIGYQAVIMLLRSGCKVIVTTRFPADAAKRFAAEEDFGEWGDRVQVVGLDLRHTPSVEAFCQTVLHTERRLDFIINNACQTVRRPVGFYDHLMELEGDLGGLSKDERRLLRAPEDDEALSKPLGRVLPSAFLSRLELLPEDQDRGEHLFPTGALDADLQQVDLRKVNSWRLRMHEVPAIELLEVHLVNAVAPFLLNARLKPLMLAVPTRDKHIVNVSAMEGQFYRVFKTDRHPHTNMAKASLNMMTRTSAVDYHEDGIHMNSVDTGWVTDEDPVHHAEEKRRVHRFHPPLDIVDGAARIVDPIFDGINTGEHVWGQFLKDYRPTDW